MQRDVKKIYSKGESKGGKKKNVKNYFQTDLGIPIGYLSGVFFLNFIVYGGCNEELPVWQQGLFGQNIFWL